MEATRVALDGVQQEALVGSRTVLDVLDAGGLQKRPTRLGLTRVLRRNRNCDNGHIDRTRGGCVPMTARQLHTRRNWSINSNTAIGSR